MSRSRQLLKELEAWQTEIQADLDENRPELGEDWAEDVEAHIEQVENLRKDIPVAFSALNYAFEMVLDMEDRGELDEDDDTSEKGNAFLDMMRNLSKRDHLYRLENQ